MMETSETWWCCWSDRILGMSTDSVLHVLEEGSLARKRIQD